MKISLRRIKFSGCEITLPRLKGVGEQLLWNDRGVIMVETALGFMALMVMILGIMECCMMGYTYSVLEAAAREGVRFASVHGTDSATCDGPSSGCDATATAVSNDVKAYSATYTNNPANMVVTVTYPDGDSKGTSRVSVSITETYQPVFHYPGAAINISVTSAGRILY